MPRNNSKSRKAERINVAGRNKVLQDIAKDIANDDIETRYRNAVESFDWELASTILWSNNEFANRRANALRIEFETVTDSLDNCDCHCESCDPTRFGWE